MAYLLVTFKRGGVTATPIESSDVENILLNKEPYQEVLEIADKDLDGFDRRLSAYNKSMPFNGSDENPRVRPQRKPSAKVKRATKWDDWDLDKFKDGSGKWDSSKVTYLRVQSKIAKQKNNWLRVFQFINELGCSTMDYCCSGMAYQVEYNLNRLTNEGA